MHREELASLHRDICNKARATLRRKNHDYAHKQEVFGNLNLCEHLFQDQKVSCEKGIILRLGDKLSRLANFTEQGLLQVKDESLRDTTEDMINYATLLIARKLEREEDLPCQPPLHIYIAGPYRNGGHAGDVEKEDNVSLAIAMGQKVTEKGHYAFVPHAATDAQEGYAHPEHFMDMDFSLIRCWADAILRLPGASKGAERETRLAIDLGLRIYYAVDEIPSITNLESPQWQKQTQRMSAGSSDMPSQPSSSTTKKTDHTPRSMSTTTGKPGVPIPEPSQHGCLANFSKTPTSPPAIKLSDPPSK